MIVPHWRDKKELRVAILDMYEGVANQGMRCIREILNQFGETNSINIKRDEFEVRGELQLPGLDYDIYISSGGPGSPLDTEGSGWEIGYFEWLNKVENWNNNPIQDRKKHVLFICHSFQLVCRYQKVANVCQRKSTAFGIFPIHLLREGNKEPVFEGLKDPFYAVDSRDFQVIQPDHNRLREMGASILALEKERPHIPLERAIMGIRFNPYMIGTQFHPEADPIGMSIHLQTEEKKKTVIDNYGIDKWNSMIEHLNDPDKILNTYSHVLPNFLNQAIKEMHPVEI